jgi:PKD repeat protein
MDRINVRNCLVTLIFLTVLFLFPATTLAAEKVLMLSTTISGGEFSTEAEKAHALGFDVEIVSPAEWEGKSPADFSNYRAIVLGDPTCGSGSEVEAAEKTADAWGPRINGNVILVGTDPVYHDSQGGRALTDSAVAYALDQGDKTGAYISLSCYEHGVDEETPVPLLDGLSTLGNFTVRGVGCYDEAHITATDSALGGITDEELSNWGCSVHEAFDTYPEDFIELAIARDIGQTYTAPDGSVGTPYILARGSGTSYLGRSYVALGDSVAAGEGIAYDYRWSPFDLRWHRFEPGDPSWSSLYTVPACHQTPEAYPRVAAYELSAKLLHLACTGATARNGVLGNRTGNVSAPAQLGSSLGGFAPPNPLYDAAEPDIVSLSIGANDVDFARRVGGCYGVDLGGCDTDQAHLDGPLAAAKHDLGLVLDEFNRRAGGGKRPLTIVTQYVDPFPAQWDDDCPDLDIPVPGLGLSKKEMDFLRKALRRLNENIADMAEEKGAFSLPVSAKFAAHPFCSSDPWTFGPSIRTNNLLGPDRDSPAPFHPTVDGQGEIGAVLASLVRQKLRISAGSNVKVKLPQGILLYENVTGPGEAIILQGSQWSPQPAASSFMKTAGFEVFSSAAYTGNISISLPSNSDQSLFHYVNGSWQLVPSSYDNGYVTGQVSSLSPFALGQPVSPVTARAESTGGGMSPAAVSFDGRASSVQDHSAISSYEWHFGDGTTSTAPAPTHTYTQSGEYVASLTVTADNGAVDEASTTTNVSNAAPIARASGPRSGLAGQVVTFDGGGSLDPNGEVESHVWDFGDGAISDVSRPSHVFDAPGIYAVDLEVGDNEGETAHDTLEVRIAAEPAAEPGQEQIVSQAEAAPVPRLFFGKRLRLDRKGRIVVPVTCAAPGPACGVRLRLSIPRRGGRLSLGAKSATIEGGHSILLRVRPRRGVLAKARRSSLTVMVSVDFTGGAPAAFSRTFKLILPPSRGSRRGSG